MLGHLIRIDWSGPLTKGRQVYASVLGIDYVPAWAINNDGGFLIGWDRWSDGRCDYADLGGRPIRPRRAHRAA